LEYVAWTYSRVLYKNLKTIEKYTYISIADMSELYAIVQTFVSPVQVIIEILK